MPVYKDPGTGRWFCKFRYADLYGNEIQKKKKGFRYKREAQEWEQDFLRNKSMSADVNLSVICEKFLELKRPTWKPLTYQNAKSIIDKHILPELGEFPANKITPIMISEWQKTMMSKVSKNTARLYKNTLSAIFSFAIKNFGLKDNPCSKSERIIQEKKEMNYITLEQFRALESNAKDENFKIALRVLFWTGMRFGEFTALTFNDIQPKYIRVNKNKIFISGSGHTIQRSTKSSNGLRKIPIHKSLYDSICDYADSIYGLGQNDFLFDIKRDWFRRRLIECCDATGVHRIRTHDLRHSHVALLIHMGYFPNAIAKRIGDTADTVMNTYAHIYEEDEKMMISKLEKADKS